MSDSGSHGHYVGVRYGGSDDEAGFDSAHRVASDEIGRARLIEQYAASLRMPHSRPRRASSGAGSDEAATGMSHSVSMPSMEHLSLSSARRVAPASQAAHWAALEAAREAVEDQLSPNLAPTTPSLGASSAGATSSVPALTGTPARPSSVESGSGSISRAPPKMSASPARPGKPVQAAPATLPFLGRSRSDSHLSETAQHAQHTSDAGAVSGRVPTVDEADHESAEDEEGEGEGVRFGQLTRTAVPGAIATSAQTVHASPAASGTLGALAASSSGDEWLDVELETAFQRVVISGDAELNAESVDVARGFLHALRLRRKHTYKRPVHYWGSFRPDDFKPDKLLYPPDEEGGPQEPAPSRYASPVRPKDTAEFDANSLFWRRRPMLPFNVLRQESMPPAIKNVRAVMRNGVVVIRMVVRADDAVQPQSPVMHGAGITSATASSLATTASLSSQPERATPATASTAAGTSTPVVPGLAPHEVLLGEPLLPGEGLGPDWFAPPTFAEFQSDYFHVCRLIHWAPAKSFSWRRLQLLESRFTLHRLLNGERESAASKTVPHRDFYNVRKVDTHVHHSACMTQKHLLRFIKHKLKTQPDMRVIVRDGLELTLAEVFRSLNLTAYDLSIDTLDMHADNTFHRFDRFNLKYNPIGQSRLREIFLKTDNHIRGKFLAEVTQQVFDDLELSKYQLAEYRLSVYGRKRSEWSTLATWVVENKLVSPNVRWMIQIPRLYEVYKKSGLVSSFQDMIDNIFLPLFEVTLDPSKDANLHQFLTLVTGFDCVDDESKHESSRDAAVPPPHLWTFDSAPPYYYWVYYLSANLRALNVLREQRGMTTFSWRPHAGEAGDVEHLAATFLTAEAVNHGITMRKNPPMQYLYYLAQVGLHMSPLSNNKLFVDYHSNPFNEFFKRGLNVSLSTDDPLLLHYTREPLVEEYCVAAQVWKLSSVDLCEIARHSVLQSGFEHPFKAHFVGQHYALPGPRGNDITLTNVPDIRLQFRLEVLTEEHSMLAGAMGLPAGTGHDGYPAPVSPQVTQTGGKSAAIAQHLRSPLSPTPPISQPALVQHHASMPKLALE